MNTSSIATLLIWVFGISVGLIIALAIIKAFNKDGKVKTKYDERQQRARGNAYRFGFYAMLISNAIFMLLDIVSLTKIFGYTSFFTSIIIGIVAQFSYAIFHDAYIGLNTNLKKYLIFMSAIAVINLAAGILPLVGGDFLEDGHFGTSFVNLLCGGMFIILAGELAIKAHLDKKDN